ncbi:MAG: hypothetical protein GF353_24870 [Candidatus Lokiarchaeota archaeon]|nr:hypothetical protein [Candidatus Lokiarchaeota archaeon]
MGDFKKMKKAYQASSKLMEKRMEKERPKDLAILKEVKDSSIIVITGSYDKIELVLDLIKVPYALIQPNELDSIELRSDQILIINCPGNISSIALEKVKEFVKKGGFLFTTDWALLNVLEKIFPYYVKYNKKPTHDDCVSVEVVDKSNKFLEGLFNDQADPIWWLEGSSYPIDILDKEKVKILVTSQEMEEKYGEAPIVITFDYGDGGTVLHMTSHYYLQRSELRSARHKKSATSYAMGEMALSEDEVKEMEQDLKDLSLGEAEAAYSTTQFISNVIVEQQKKVKEREEKKVPKDKAK